jgi:simple sugar transport system substrate-binding protein
MVKPDITTQVIFTGDWSLPVKEAEATNSLIDQGIDVVTCHVDSPKVVVETTARRGAYICGYHASQAKLAPKQYLTGAEWNWQKVYTDYIKMMETKKAIPNLVRGGLKEGVVKTSPYGPEVSAAAKEAAEKVKAQFMAGSYAIFKGPIASNKGAVAIAAGTTLAQTDIKLESMDYLVEGVVGSTS